VIGPSGSGKTVVLGFLLAQAQRFAPRAVFFDKDRGAEILLRAIGGTYRVVPLASSPEPDTRSCGGATRSNAAEHRTRTRLV
jgi:type IV secretory pathway VirB4 component